MEIVELILAIVGLISLAVTVFRIIWVIRSPRNEWKDNVSITEISAKESEDLTDVLSDKGTVFFDPETPVFCRSVSEVRPNGCDIRKIKIRKLNEETVPKGNLKYKTIETVSSITPDQPLYMVVERGEAIAQYMIEWKIEYGEKARYFFYEDLRSGNNNRCGTFYTSGLLCKLRKILGFK